jgi:hypothetical protein
MDTVLPATATRSPANQGRTVATGAAQAAAAPATAPVRFAGRLRALVALGVMVMATLAPATPAHAHAVTGVKASDYRSEIVGISGPSDARALLDVRLLDLGRRVELVNRGTVDVVVLGYDGEPWLRVGPRGTFENEYSNSAYQERQRRGRVSGPPPDPARAAGEPRWRRTGDGNALRWRDRRTRRDGPAPDQVQQAPDARHLIVPRWTVELRRGDDPLAIAGRIVYVPPPPPLPAALAAAAVFFATLLTTRSARWPLILSALMALLVAVDVVHTFANAAVSGGSLAKQAGNVLSGGSFVVLAWLLGAASIDPLRRRTDAGLILAGASALMIAFYGGVTDATALAASQVPSALTPFVLRAAVVLSLGLGFGIVVVVLYEGIRGPSRVGDLQPARRATTVRR